MIKNKFSERCFLFVLMLYFLIAPIYIQSVVPDLIWLSIKYTLLGIVFISVGIISLMRGRIQFSTIDMLFISSIIVFSLYALRGQFFFVVLIGAYIFYFIGRHSFVLANYEKTLDWLAYAARGSAFFIMFSVLQGNVTGSFSGEINPNTWSLYVATNFAVLLYSYERKSNKIDLLFLAFLTISILLVGSRGGILCITFLTAVYLRNYMNIKTLISISLLILIAVYFLIKNDYISDLRIINQFYAVSAGDNIDLTSGRKDGYSEAMSLFFQFPIIGYGPVDLNFFGLGYRQIHNFYLRILTEFGLLGFGFLLILMVSIARRCLRSLPMLTMLAHCLLVLFFIPLLYEPNGLFGNFMIAGMLWFLFGLVCGRRGDRFNSQKY